jgi:hypothetical protein
LNLLLFQKLDDKIIIEKNVSLLSQSNNKEPKLAIVSSVNFDKSKYLGYFFTKSATSTSFMSSISIHPVVSVVHVSVVVSVVGDCFVARLLLYGSINS